MAGYESIADMVANSPDARDSRDDAYDLFICSLIVIPMLTCVGLPVAVAIYKHCTELGLNQCLQFLGFH